MTPPPSDPDCLFCRIVRREVPATIVYEDESVLAFRDVAPKSPTHILVIPKAHLSRLSEATAGDAALLGRVLHTLTAIAAKEGLTDYRVVANNGAGAGQSVFHVHFHLMSGRAFAWPPG